MLIVRHEVRDEAASSHFRFSCFLVRVSAHNRLGEPSLELLNLLASGLSNCLVGGGVGSSIVDFKEFLDSNGVSFLEQVTDFLQSLESLVRVVHHQVVQGL